MSDAAPAGAPRGPMGGFLRTLREVFLEPGRLTEEHIKGRRHRWLTPVVIFTVCSVVFFLTGSLVDRLSPRETNAAFMSAEPEMRAAVVKRLEQSMDAATAEAAVDNHVALYEMLAVNVPRMTFILMPVFALITWAAWRAGGLSYRSHLDLSMQVHAALFAAMSIGVVSGLFRSAGVELAVGAAIVAYSTWYAVAAMRRVLGGTPRQVFLRSTAAGLVYAVVFLTAIVGALTVTLVSA